MTLDHRNTVLAATAVLACSSPPPAEPDAGDCDEECQDFERRIFSRDAVARMPDLEVWFEDFAATVAPPARCGTGPESQGPVRLLWRKPLLPTWGGVGAFEQNFTPETGVTNLSVAAGVGVLALPTFSSVHAYVFDAWTGKLRHAYEGLASDGAFLARDGRTLFEDTDGLSAWRIDTSEALPPGPLYHLWGWGGISRPPPGHQPRPVDRPGTSHRPRPLVCIQEPSRSGSGGLDRGQLALGGLRRCRRFRVDRCRGDDLLG